MPTSSDILSVLRAHATELHERYGVQSLAVFGSAARGEMTPGSDVDVLVQFNSTATFDLYMDLKDYLEDLLACSVDLVTHAALKNRMRPLVESEAVRVA
ncbi:MAG: DNA polymerase subunit beta [Phycisphaera sp.]|nr:DNA polymerase subunit beta [Phycisphaera sp.]